MTAAGLAQGPHGPGGASRALTRAFSNTVTIAIAYYGGAAGVDQPGAFELTACAAGLAPVALPLVQPHHATPQRTGQMNRALAFAPDVIDVLSLRSSIAGEDGMTVNEIVAKAKRVTTLAEYDDAVREMQTEWSSGIEPARVWFRGHRVSSWSLHPLGLRTLPLGGSLEKDNELFVEFKRRALGLVDHLPTTAWAWLYLAQHHGLPTRLLDWTESAHVGLFFALLSKPGSGQDPDCDACVWVLNPGGVNERVFDFSNAVVMEDGNAEFLLAPYLHGLRADDPENKNRNLLAVIPEYVTERLRAQRGAFVAFGEDKDALEKLITNTSIHPPLGRALVIGREVVHKLRRELDLAGVGESTVFPDIDGLCAELARRRDRP